MTNIVYRFYCDRFEVLKHLIIRMSFQKQQLKICLVQLLLFHTVVD